MTRVLRCAACTRRIRDSHAHIGLIDLESGREITYHASSANPSCQRRGAEVVGTSGFTQREDILSLNPPLRGPSLFYPPLQTRVRRPRKEHSVSKPTEGRSIT